MIGAKEWFTELDESYQHRVTLGNDHRLEVKGRGSVRVFVNGAFQIITGLYYVPMLTSNLISVSQLQDKGMAFVIQAGECRVYHPVKGLILSSYMTKNKMFPFMASTRSEQAECMQVVGESKTQL